MNKLSELVSELVNNIETKKQTILLDRIDKVSNNEFCPEIESERRFKSVLHESHPNRDTYYYNNGSIDGIHLVTFYKPKDFGITNFNMEFKNSFEFKYTFEKP